MNEYQRYTLKTEIIFLAIALGLIVWSFLKAYLMGSQVFVFNWETINVLVALVLGIVFLVSGVKSFIKYKRRGRVSSSFDERTARIFNDAMATGGVVLFLTVFFVSLYAWLFYGSDAAVFTLKDVTWMIMPGVIVYVLSVYWNIKKKK